ncbi:SNF2-related protein [Niallia taxi]|uniref:SNF2-related protein n=1 Tax=Niallia taxi TaxID=2499688 RepID=UPI0015F64988|nr:SNF2-related protein [Niallia taxi]
MTRITGLYEGSNEVIPQDKRQMINEKILMLIDAGNTKGITQKDVYNAYTGEGGLHGLNFEEFDSFHSFTTAKKEIENGQFLTPSPLSQFLVECLQPTQADLIADLTMGAGAFFNFLPNLSNVYGNELDVKAYKVAKHLYPSANLTLGDIRHYSPKVSLDIVLGNPPFNLKWRAEGQDYWSQFYYCKKAYELLKPSGIMALIVPSSFLADDFMDRNGISEMEEMFNFIVQFDIPANSFKNVGVSHFETKVMFFQKKSEHLMEVPYTTAKLSPAPPITEEGAECIYNEFIKSVVERKEKIRAKVFLENVNRNKADVEFSYKVKKLLFDIKRNPKISRHHKKCQDYVNQYYSQSKPDEMNWKDWERKRLTKPKVLSYLKRYIKMQHHVEKDEIRLVKTRYGVKLKGYSHKMRLQLAKSTDVKEMSFNDMVLEDHYPFTDKKYLPLFEKKKKAYEKQSKDFTFLSPSAEINRYLGAFQLKDHSTGQILRLNPMQKGDLAKVLMKDYSILNWEQGSGKTLGSIAWLRYMFKKKTIRNVFVVSSAIAISMTWEPKLTDYQQDFIRINRLRDIENIKEGQIVLITLNQLVKFQKHMKKYIRKQSQKVAMVLDESDSLSNYRSRRTRAVLSVFRKVNFKLLATGTTTRNTINELYPQLELIYNNSINLLCEGQFRYTYNKDNELEQQDNEYDGLPFPAHYGQSIFKSVHCPAKATVFGIRKENQDVYNAESLERIIRKTVITRRFKEIVGEDKYEIITHRIKQNPSEVSVYEKIMMEFYTMVWNYFKSTGNDRKDRMLMLIRQIQLLIKSTSIPHKFGEYQSNKAPNKFNYIGKMLKKYSDEKVAIGTVFIESSEQYYRLVQKLFPNRPVFLIKGAISFKKRAEIVRQFESTKDGVLISTMQALESSVNIPSCNKIIIESMLWNIPRISQYFFRFIRYDSTDFKEVHFVTYDNTIEQNLMGLLMAKQRLNEYIKTLDFKEQAEIFEEFGVDLDILNALIEKAYDKDGKLYLTWGRQKVV